MGRREPEFEVERRREDRTPVGDVDLTKNDTEGKDDKATTAAGGDTGGGGGDGTWTSWAEDPRNVDNMKYFILAQSFVVFLTFGLPQLQKCWALFMEWFN